MASVVSRFATAVRERDVGLTRVEPAGLPEALGEILEEPVVGTSVPSVPSVDVEALPVAVNTDPTPAELDGARTGLTGAPLAIADYGSVLVQGGDGGAEPVSLYPDRHVAVVRADDVVADMETAMGEIADLIAAGHRSHVVATGPSATADMGDLVRGAHGPKEVHVVVVNDE
ncbi:MAG: LUD domain-containing protein [Halodesulfurarchaeum sp.]